VAEQVGAYDNLVAVTRGRSGTADLSDAYFAEIEAKFG